MRGVEHEANHHPSESRREDEARLAILIFEQAEI